MSEEIDYHEHDWSNWFVAAWIEDKPVAFVRSCKKCYKIESVNEDVDISGLTV